VFYAKIKIENGRPVITWHPDLEHDPADARAYTLWGNETLNPAGWTTQTNCNTRFFRVDVDLPGWPK